MDLFRRDFSINALAVRLDSTPFGQLLDFFGGQRDIKERLIRVLHTLSFVEDPTRCLRAVRFEQRYKFKPDPDAGGYDLLETAARKRGFLISGGEVDTERMAAILLDEFRGGKLGRITLEWPEAAEEK